MAALDWLQNYETMLSGNYGGTSAGGTAGTQTFQDLIGGNKDYQNLLQQGILTQPTYRESPNNEAGPVQINESTGIDWSKLPHMGPAGDTPQNSMWRIVGGRSGMQADPNAPTYNDPNYGMLQLVQQRAPDDMTMKLMRTAAIAMASAGIGGGISAAGEAAAEAGAGAGAAGGGWGAGEAGGWAAGLQGAGGGAAAGTVPNFTSTLIKEMMTLAQGKMGGGKTGAGTTRSAQSGSSSINGNLGNLLKLMMMKQAMTRR